MSGRIDDDHRARGASTTSMLMEFATEPEPAVGTTALIR
jgi:hypothetical protein